MSERNYKYIVKTTDNDVHYCETIEGDLSKTESILKLTGRYKDGNKWEVTLKASGILSIKEELGGGDVE